MKPLTIEQPRSAAHSQDFSELCLISGPEFMPALFGGTHQRVARNLHRYRGNMFSYQHTRFAMVDGKVAGLMQCYDWVANRQEQLKTTLLIARYMRSRFIARMRPLQWSGQVLGRMDDGTFYISNMAVYPDYRGQGLCTALLQRAEEEARGSQATSIALDAETDNEYAIRQYRRFGMNAAGQPRGTVIDGRHFEFIRMSKDI